MSSARTDFKTFTIADKKFKKYIEEELVSCVAFVIQSSDVFEIHVVLSLMPAE
jgi:hypothetical protein